MELTSDAAQQIWVPGDGDVLRVTPDGLWPSGDAFIPAERYAGTAVRAWQWPHGRTSIAWVGLAVLVDDGTTVCVPSVSRRLDRKPDNRCLYWRSSERREWAAIADEAGAPALTWSALNDPAVGAMLDRVIRGVLRPLPGADRAPDRLRKVAGIRKGSGAVLARAMVPGANPLVWAPLREIPQAVPLVPSPAELPAWDLPDLPVCFRSRATSRWFRRRDCVRFSPSGLDLVCGRDVTSHAYNDIDRIDDAYDLDGVRRLSAVLVDGTAIELPGVRHGSWVADPTLRHNELLWWAGDRPVGEPQGRMPWGSNDDPIVIARLRAQLAAAHGTAKR